ncbi:MAG: hypothetical protein J3R72DRAFT_70288 [Linnemannia gamsii]|nr:MAG: hypothetical protein J3R72DRAFT_70288 [Linnemannia gamsii]
MEQEAKRAKIKETTNQSKSCQLTACSIQGPPTLLFCPSIPTPPYPSTPFSFNLHCLEYLLFFFLTTYLHMHTGLLWLNQRANRLTLPCLWSFYFLFYFSSCDPLSGWLNFLLVCCYFLLPVWPICSIEKREERE